MVGPRHREMVVNTTRTGQSATSASSASRLSQLSQYVLVARPVRFACDWCERAAATGTSSCRSAPLSRTEWRVSECRLTFRPVRNPLSSLRVCAACVRYAGSPVGWLAGWLVGRLVAWLAGCWFRHPLTCVRISRARISRVP